MARLGKTAVNSFHMLLEGGYLQFCDYMDRLDELSGRAGWRPPVFKAITVHFSRERAHTRTNKYRNIRYLVNSEKEFEVVQLCGEEEEAESAEREGKGKEERNN